MEGTRVRWQGFDMDQWTFSIAAPIRSKTARPDRIHEGHSKRYRERLRDDLKSDGRQAATVQQQDIQAAHRIRSELTKQRTAKANQIRGLVAEYGLVAPKEIAHLRRALPCWLEDTENGLSERFRLLLNGLWGDLRALDDRMAELDREIALIAQSDPVAKRLQQLRGVGPVIATALVAAAGNGEQFANGRQMSAAFGLTPRQHSSGGKERLLGISKRGDAYLRTLLIHGARSVIRTAKDKDDRLSQWVTRLAQRRHPNVVAAALANKTTRMAWAMLRNGTDYQPDLVAG